MFTFLQSWNEYLFALVFIDDDCAAPSRWASRQQHDRNIQRRTTHLDGGGGGVGAARGGALPLPAEEQVQGFTAGGVKG